MNADLELVAWRSDWLAEPASGATVPPADLRHLVERKGRRIALEFFAQLLLGVSMLAFSAWFAARHPSAEWILWAAVIWAGTFVSAGFAIWNHSGIWRALSHSNAAFLDLSRERCLRDLRAVRYGHWFLAVQLAIIVSWFSLDFALHRMPLRAYFFGCGLAIVIAIGYLQWFSHRERRTRGDLAQLEEFDSYPLPIPNP